MPVHLRPGSANELLLSTQHAFVQTFVSHSLLTPREHSELVPEEHVNALYPESELCMRRHGKHMKLAPCSPEALAIAPLHFCSCVLTAIDFHSHTRHRAPTMPWQHNIHAAINPTHEPAPTRPFSFP